MSTDLKSQIHNYGRQLADSQTPITDADIAELVGKVRHVSPAPVRSYPKARPMVAAAAGIVVLVVFGVVALLARTGGTDAPPATNLAPAPSVANPPVTVAPTEAVSFTPSDPSVLVNGGWLAYECRGEGSPTVIVEIGASKVTERDPNWTVWGGIIDRIAETNKVCIYGRRGVVGSEPLPVRVSRTTQDAVDDLDGLIEALELETPVILVGYSVAGYNVRLFAGQHPEKVAGLVFVDAADPGVQKYDPIRASNIWAPEWLDFAASAEQVAAVSDLGNLPVYVLTAMSEDPAISTDPDRPDWWFDLQDDLLALSSNSAQRKLDANHQTIMLVEADALINAVAWVTSEAR